jgi:hypothetical protein
MDHRLDSRQEAALLASAERFVARHQGDLMEALKELILLNGQLEARLETCSPLARPGDAAR